MPRVPSILDNRPNLFTSPFKRQILDGSGQVKLQSLDDILNSGLVSTSSFRFDTPGQALKSTQQVNTDFSKFENHTFFNSAVANVNVSFDNVINKFPFDGPRQELETFLDGLSGFEKHVYDGFPKNKGYLFFSGTAVNEDPSNGYGENLGTFIKTFDHAGTMYPTLSTLQTGEEVLDPGMKSLSLETHLYVPKVSNDNQIVCQMISGNSHGFCLALSQSNSIESVPLVFSVVSSSLHLHTTASLNKGVFNHICAIVDRTPSERKLKIFINEKLISTSSNSAEFGDFEISGEVLTIGSGTSQNNAVSKTVSNVSVSQTTSFVPKQTFSGALDDFRLFHSVREVQDQENFGKKGIFSSDDLKLYFKFNEPFDVGSTSNKINSTVLDSSGNSLHSQISNFSKNLRNTGSIKNPMKHEKLSLSPVLFPSYPPTIRFNSSLLTTASNYDSVNPNLITNLIPEHYLLEGKEFEALYGVTGTIGNTYSGDEIPGSGVMGSPQLLSSFLFVWSKLFDEMKIYLDALSSVNYVTYKSGSQESAPDQFLINVASYYGFELPNLFNRSSVEQFLEGENLTTNIGTEKLSLQEIQNEIWRRVLSNLRSIINSKGTIDSVKQFIRTIGIDPDSNFRVKEYGGPSSKTMVESRLSRTDVSTMLEFSGSLGKGPTATNVLGISDSYPFVRSPFLSGARKEVGFPEPYGTFVQKGGSNGIHGISNQTHDGLFTSGSFSYEGIYRFPQRKINVAGTYPATQSLVRMNVTGSSFIRGGTSVNLVVMSGSASSDLRLFARPSTLTAPSAMPALQRNPLLTLELTGVNLFDGGKWNVSFGRFRPDDPQSPYYGQSGTSSSYFLRCAKQSFGRILEYYTTQSFFHEEPRSSGGSTFTNTHTSFNQSGSFLVFGSQSLPAYGWAGGNDMLLDKTNVPDPAARSTNFGGQVGHIRFWSKGLVESEWQEHIKNYKSVGVENPLKNFNFETVATGSFSRLRLDVSTDQIVTSSTDLGRIQLFDFTQQTTSGTRGAPWNPVDFKGKINFHMSGSGFETSSQVIVPETFRYSFISPNFDEAATNEKVRPRSFQDDFNLSQNPFASKAPVYSLPYLSRPEDDVRFTIDFSVSDKLNEDIITIFSSLDILENALGNPDLLFSPDYPDLENIRQVYFDRLTDRMNLKGFFEFFKWFDSSMSLFIESLLPRKTRFLGVNFVVESHMLERNKIEYQFSNTYVNSDVNPSSRLTSILQEYGGSITRF